jgi:GT2 family glycosyltransferase
MSYRAEAGLEDAVGSLLVQEEPVEVVVVNSGGGEPAARLRAAGLDVPVLDVPGRLFPGAARNRGVKVTRAPFVAFMAADCMAAPGWASARLARHRAGVDAVAGAMGTANPENAASCASLLLLHRRRLPEAPARRRPHLSLSFRRALLERTGSFREDLRAGEDTEFAGRLPASTRVVWAPDVRTLHRYPTTSRDLLEDQFARGRRRARAESALRSGLAPWRLAVRALFDAVPCVLLAARVDDPVDRGRLRGSLPLLVPATLAYTMGLLTSTGTERRDLSSPHRTPGQSVRPPRFARSHHGRGGSAHR